MLLVLSTLNNRFNARPRVQARQCNCILGFTHFWGIPMKIITTMPPEYSVAPASWRWGKRSLVGFLGLLSFYGMTAYIILPALWRHYECNPHLEHSPKTTQTADGIPGDPINVGLVGSQAEVIQAMLQAGWHPADPVTLRSSLGIAKSVLLKQPYPDAPVSSLYFLGRNQDLAFEQPVGSSASTRHHVRFWQTNEPDPATNRTLWMGSATFDRSAGVSHLKGQITHHIRSDIDAERDTLLQNLAQSQQVTETYNVTGVGSTLQGHNGGGDWYYTDGEMTIAVLPIHNQNTQYIPTRNSQSEVNAIMLKNQFWQWYRNTFKPKV
jgi:LssY C-terminus